MLHTLYTVFVTVDVLSKFNSIAIPDVLAGTTTKYSNYHEILNKIIQKNGKLF